MQIGFVGLGRMGGNMVARIRRDSDHEVVAFDFDAQAVARAKQTGATGVASLRALVKALEPPRTVWIMVPAGDPTQKTVEALAKLLGPDDAIVDGGNSKWTDDKTRAEMLRKQKIHYIDVGTSGGVWGLEVGYCMMVGGPVRAVRRLAPILDVLAPPTAPDSVAAIGPHGWHHFGPSGAGHYVKMVHNAIEYGLMQAYAEGFELFEQSEYDLDNAKIAHLWNQGSVIRSWLCELAARAFEADGNDLAGLEGWVEDSGEGRWTLQDAIDHGVPTPALSAALNSRFYSRELGDYSARVLAALRNQFGGHAVRPSGAK
jgi:6-phosphogluconate dehydrogenase